MILIAITTLHSIGLIVCIKNRSNDDYKQNHPYTQISMAHRIQRDTRTHQQTILYGIINIVLLPSQKYHRLTPCQSVQ